MKKIGITGQQGFIGNYLYNTLKLTPNLYQIIEFERDYFKNEDKLNHFVSKCDVIVHLAAMNRHDVPQVIYDTNIGLVVKLINSCNTSNSKPHILFSSSSQEEQDNLYGNSKKAGRKLFQEWSVQSGATFSGLIIPNVFGPFGKPFFNSVISTFCHQIVNDNIPTIHKDGNLKLIYVADLVKEIIIKIEEPKSQMPHIINYTKEIKVSEILTLLEVFKKSYKEKSEIPIIHNAFELNLFNTFRSFIDIENYFPVKYNEYSDSRGSFVELVRLGIGGQVSFSTTKPNITRGNHYHTRKIERFSVIKGQALIQLRKIGTKKIFNFYLNGDEPSYVDMPIWYTHNIKNIGNETLYTNFWINEPYNEEDSDTYIEEV